MIFFFFLKLGLAYQHEKEAYHCLDTLNTKPQIVQYLTSYLTTHNSISNLCTSLSFLGGLQA